MSAYYNEIDAYAAQWLRNLIAKNLIAKGDVDERSICEVDSNDLKTYKQCHFFAGIGGWSYALRLARWHDDRPIWTGSCPCQPFSVAGKGAGTDDPRHLWPHFHRLITAIRPPVVMGEQVAGQAGYGWLDGVRADLARENYASRGVDIPACSVDAPHIRQRLYWVASDMGHTHDTGLERYAGHGDGRERRAPEDGPTAQASSGHMADADDAKRRQDGPGGYDNHRDQAGWNQNASDAGTCDEGDVADARLFRSFRSSREEQYAERRFQFGEGFWSDAIWLTGSDGKARRTKPGLPLLAHGVSNRVGRLRAYGNAIVPPLAAEVIKAFMECEP